MNGTDAISSAVLLVGALPTLSHSTLNKSLTKHGWRSMPRCQNSRLNLQWITAYFKIIVREENVFDRRNSGIQKICLCKLQRDDCKLFWQRGWDVFSNSKEFVIYKHVPDVLAMRHFSEMKCQECAWEQQVPFVWRPISVLQMRCVHLSFALRAPHPPARRTVTIPSLVILAARTSC